MKKLVFILMVGIVSSCAAQPKTVIGQFGGIITTYNQTAIDAYLLQKVDVSSLNLQHVLAAGGTTSLPISTSGAITSTSSVNGLSFVKSGGTAAQFLMADGSVNSNSFSNYLPLVGGTLTGPLTGTAATFVGALTMTGNYDMYNYMVGDISGSPSPLAVTGAGHRMFYWADMAAFRAGYVDGNEWDDANIGTYSAAFGNATTASGTTAFAVNSATTASGDNSFSSGSGTFAIGVNSLVSGANNYAAGDNSIASGIGNYANGANSFASGSGNLANGANSFAMGSNSTTNGANAFAMGANSIAGTNSMAMGRLVNTNNRQGSFVLGDSDPLSGGSTIATAADQFTGRFNGGYSLLGGAVTATSFVKSGGASTQVLMADGHSANSTLYNTSSSTGLTLNSATTPVAVSGATATPTVAGTYRVEFNGQMSATPANISTQNTYDLATLVSNLNAMTVTTTHAAAYGGETLTTGVYSTAGASTIAGTLVFDAAGNPNATFVIRIGAALAIAASANMTLVNGAQSSNIFWVINGAPSMGANDNLKGTYIAISAAVSAGTGLTLDGRLLSTGGAIATTNAIMNAPSGTSAITVGDLSSFILYTNSGAIGNTGTFAGSGDINTALGAISGYTGLVGNNYPANSMLAAYSLALYQSGSVLPYTTRYFRTAISNPNSAILSAYVTATASAAITMQATVTMGSVTIGDRTFTALSVIQ